MVDDEWRFTRPVLNCLCGEEYSEAGDGKEGILRCAGCEGTVMKTDGRAWDPFAGEFVEVFGWRLAYDLASGLCWKYTTMLKLKLLVVE